MVSFSLTEEQRALQTLAREFAEREIKPVALEMDAKPDPAECMSWDLVRKMSKAGFRTLAVPKGYGGGGVDSCLTFCVLGEELSVADTGITCAVIFMSLKMAHFFREGTEEQRQKYLRPFCEDDEFLMSNSFTEPESGVDHFLPYDAPRAGLMTSVRQDGDYYILNGNKRYIQNTGVGKLDILGARTDPNVGVSQGMTLFIITLPREGYHVVRVHDKWGQRCALNYESHLENVRVHKSDILGPWNGGFQVLQKILLHGDNLVNGARSVGIARAAYEDTLAYAKERVQGGKPIIQHQAVAMELMDMFTEVEAARALLWYAAWRIDNRDTVPFNPTYGTAASILCNEMAPRVCTNALKIWGGAGVVERYQIPITKYLRDALCFGLHGDGGVHMKRIKAGAFL